jgi:hypothetical protein
MRTFYIPRDQMVIDELIIQGYKLWNIIEAAGQRGFDSVHIEKYENALVKYMKEHHVSWNEAKNAVPVLDETFMS